MRNNTFSVFSVDSTPKTGPLFIFYRGHSALQDFYDEYIYFLSSLLLFSTRLYMSGTLRQQIWPVSCCIFSTPTSVPRASYDIDTIALRCAPTAQVFMASCLKSSAILIHVAMSPPLYSTSFPFYSDSMISV